jgi:hypothetical protein
MQMWALETATGKHKGKDKVIPVLSLNDHHAMKAYWRGRGIALLIL